MIHRFIHAIALALVSMMFGCTSMSTSTTRQADGSRPHKRYDIADFMNTTRMSGLGFFADEQRLLISSDETGIFNAFAVNTEDGSRTALTKSTADSTYAVSPFPADDRVLFTRDIGGDENNHLYVRNTDGSEHDLTPASGVKAIFAGWRGDDEAFYVQLNERNQKFFDLYEFNTRDYSRRIIFQDDVGYALGPVSDNGRWLALTKSRTQADTDIFILDVTTGETRLISPHTGSATYSAQCFDPAGEWFYYLTNDGSDFTRARRYHLQSHRHEEVEKAPWDIQFIGFSRHGRYRYLGINKDGRTEVRIMETASGRPLKLPPLPPGEISDLVFSRRENTLAFYLNGDRSPHDLWQVDLRSGKARQLSRNLSPAVDPADLVEAQVVRFKSFDGLVIPNILWRPHQANSKAPAPAVVLVHGGPGGQMRLGYFSLSQYLANHGYVVLGINNRGSSGYGLKFFSADDRRHGREPLRDCVEAQNWLARQPYVDGKRIAIVGGSYGGYMALAALAFHPDVFNAGVDVFGVSNWIRTLENMPPYWEAFREAAYHELGHPVKDREMLRAISPLFHAEHIRKPLLVIQGANDPRVMKSESDDIVAAVRGNGVPVEYIVFPDEGHGFSKRANEVTAWNRILEFLDREMSVK